MCMKLKRFHQFRLSNKKIIKLCFGWGVAKFFVNNCKLSLYICFPWIRMFFVILFFHKSVQAAQRYFFKKKLAWMQVNTTAVFFLFSRALCFVFITSIVFLFSTENAAEEKLWRENADYKNPSEFIFIHPLFPQYTTFVSSCDKCIHFVVRVNFILIQVVLIKDEMFACSFSLNVVPFPQ